MADTSASGEERDCQPDLAEVLAAQTLPGVGAMSDPVSNTPPPGADLIARARAALEGVTEGPWTFGVRNSDVAQIVPGERPSLLRPAAGLAGIALARLPDAHFIVAARQLVPELTDHLAELEQAVARVRELCADPPISDIDRYRDGDWRLDADILKGLITAVFDALDETGTPVTEIDPEIDKAVREAMTGLIAKVNALQLAARGALRQLNLYLESGERLRLHVATASLESVLPDGRTEAP